MVKILGIVCSPRIGGNTEIMVRKALKSAKKVKNVNTELILLGKKNIAPCDGCKICIKTRKCRIQDDMQKIYGKLLEADGIIIGTPVRFRTISAQGKAFIDRTHAIAIRGLLANKVGGAIAVGQGRHGGQEATVETIHNFFINEGMIVVGTGIWDAYATGIAREKGEMIYDKQGLREAGALGERIARIAKALQVGLNRPK